MTQGIKMSGSRGAEPTGTGSERRVNRPGAERKPLKAGVRSLPPP